MAYTTFGEQLRKMLNDRKISQRKLSEAITGDPSDTRQLQRLLKFERGIGMIEDTTLENLIDGFKKLRKSLSYSDTVYLYGLAGKFPTLKPTHDQIIEGINKFLPSLEKHPYPAYILGIRNFRYFAINAATVKLIGGYNRVDELANHSVFELIFAKKWGIVDLLGEKIEVVRREQVRRYIALNTLSRHEDFYMEYPEKLKNLMTPKEYENFLEIWLETNPDRIPETDYGILGEIDFVIPDNEKQISLKIHLNPEVIAIPSLANFFTIVRYEIKDTLHQGIADMFFHPQEFEKKCIKIWELPNIDQHELFL
jgi:hypothetical protein